MSRLWTTADGRRVPVDEMDDGHLLNSIKYLKNRSVVIALTDAPADDPRPKKLQEYHKKENLRQIETSLRILVGEAKRRKLDEWTKFGLTVTETLDSE